MTAQKITLRRFGAALFALTLTGCAQVIGIDDFTLTGGSASSGEPVDPCNDVHGCKRELAEDLTGVSPANIGFGSTGYEPRCAIVQSGATVEFKGSGYTFDELPIAGGVFPTVDASSPIQNPSPSTSSTATFILGSACSYPYFSPGALEKTGVIFIE